MELDVNEASEDENKIDDLDLFLSAKAAWRWTFYGCDRCDDRFHGEC